MLSSSWLFAAAVYLLMQSLVTGLALRSCKRPATANFFNGLNAVLGLFLLGYAAVNYSKADIGE